MSHRELEPQHVELLARAVEQVADPVEICDADYRLRYVNRAFERVTGYSRDEALGHTPEELLRGEDHPPEFYGDIDAVLRDKKVWSGRVRSRTRDGRRLVCDVVITPVLDDGEAVTHFVCVRRDVTDNERIESQLMQSDRLAAVGHLAAGVAHEINNPLAYVLGNTAYVKESVEEVGHAFEAGTLEELRSALIDIEHGAARIRDIVHDLSAFSRPSEDTAHEVDVRSVIDSSINLLHNEVKHRARLVRDYQDVPPIWVERTRLGQVFLNLVLNAVQAIPVGSASENEIRLSTRTDESGDVVVEVRDTGAGIAPEVVPHIFDPFFTTRTVGEGTGLGLAVAHAIVESLGGSIGVQSQPGEGTTFAVHLPPLHRVIDEHVAAEDDRGQRPFRILVVDDEPGVLRAMSRMLRDQEVVTRQNGEDALAALERDHYDVVFCDLMMPDMSGMEVYRRALEANPALDSRFAFITGGAYTEDARSFLAHRTNPTVEKPFKPGALRGVLEQLAGTGRRR